MSDSYRNFIETVRIKSDIVTLVSDYVELKKRGGKYWGCCPFHQEKTASFSVTPDKGLFYCFGCHIGGDAISFVQKIENLSFKDSIAIIANKYGIAVPEQHKSSYQKEKEQVAEEIYKINSLAVDYFTACLYKTMFGQSVLEYLNNRGITKKTIEKFSLGASLPNWDSLYKAFSKRTIDVDLMIKARLIASRSNGYYDSFRSRLMIPIKDARGKVVGFGGRIIGDDNPKYLNTSESDWFNKRFLLYGLDVAIDEIRKEKKAIVVEGYMDAISLHSSGITNVVASLGTAFSEQQAKLLLRIAPEIVFCYDSDLAGQQATVRSISIARKLGLDVKAILLTDSKDPDEFVIKNGASSFLQLVKQAKSGFEYQKDYVLAQTDFSSLAGKMEVVSNILPMVAELENEIEIRRNVMLLAQKLVIDESAINIELNKYLTNNKKNTIKISTPKKVSMVDSNKSILKSAESHLIRAIIEKQSVMNYVVENIEEIVFSNDSFAEIFDVLKNQLTDGFSREELFAKLSEKSKAVLAELLVGEIEYGDLDKGIEDCLKQIKIAYLEKQYNIHNNNAIEYERLGDSRFLQELAKSQEIKNEIKTLH